jgi:hypothetical protein
MSVKVRLEQPPGKITAGDEADGLTELRVCQQPCWIGKTFASRFQFRQFTVLVADLGSVAEHHPQEIVQMVVQSDVESSLAEHIKQVPGTFLTVVALGVFHQIMSRPSVC